MLRSLGLGLVLATLNPGASHAFMVEDFLPGCEEAARFHGNAMRTTANICLGTAQGVGQILVLYCVVRSGSSGRLQADLADVNGAALAQTWVNWARADPARSDDDFYVSMFMALRETFPCTK